MLQCHCNVVEMRSIITGHPAGSVTPREFVDMSLSVGSSHQLLAN